MKREEKAELCAHCGAPIEDEAAECEECHFVYCVDHADREAHRCEAVCEECRQADAEAP